MKRATLTSATTFFGPSLMGWYLPSPIARTPDDDPSTNSIGGGKSLLNASRSFAGLYEESSANRGEGSSGEASILERKGTGGLAASQTRDQSRRRPLKESVLEADMGRRGSKDRERGDDGGQRTQAWSKQVPDQPQSLLSPVWRARASPIRTNDSSPQPLSLRDIRCSSRSLRKRTSTTPPYTLRNTRYRYSGWPGIQG